MKTILLPLLVLPLPLDSLRGQTDASATELLEHADRVLRPAKSFVVTVQARTFKNRVEQGLITLRAFVRMPQTSSSPESLAILTEPPAEQGKVYLRKPDGEFWFFDSRAKRPVRLSPQQRLHGQASLDDFMSVNLKADYSGRLEAPEDVTDASGKSRPCERLRLTARTKAAPFPAITLWLDKGNRQPVKATCFAAAGRALRSTYYDKFRGFLGDSRPTEIVIVDEVRPGLVTQVRFSDFDERDMPETWFHPAFLPDAVRALKP